MWKAQSTLFYIYKIKSSSNWNNQFFFFPFISLFKFISKIEKRQPSQCCCQQSFHRTNSSEGKDHVYLPCLDVSKHLNTFFFISLYKFISKIEKGNPANAVANSPFIKQIAQTASTRLACHVKKSQST